MDGKYQISDARKSVDDGSRNISPSPDRTDEASLSASLPAETGKTFLSNRADEEM
jgi:hypothetical protein